MLGIDHVKHIWPRCRPDYLATLTSKFAWDTMVHFEIVGGGSYKRLAGFLANCTVECGGGTIKRESLNYSTFAQLQKVWPARFVYEKARANNPLKFQRDSGMQAIIARAKSCSKDEFDAWVHTLLRNESGLADAVYGGRMGNRLGTTDAYDYRGAGWLQCTGRDATIAHYRHAGVDVEANPALIDDTNVSFTVACDEWKKSGCNADMDADRFSDACVAINAGRAALAPIRTGKATHRQVCQSLPARLEAYEKCKAMFQIVGDPELHEGTEDEDEAEWEDEDEVEEAVA